MMAKNIFEPLYKMRDAISHPGLDPTQLLKSAKQKSVRFTMTAANCFVYKDGLPPVVESSFVT